MKDHLWTVEVTFDMPVLAETIDLAVEVAKHNTNEVDYHEYSAHLMTAHEAKKNANCLPWTDKPENEDNIGTIYERFLDWQQELKNKDDDAKADAKQIKLFSECDCG